MTPFVAALPDPELDALYRTGFRCLNVGYFIMLLCLAVDLWQQQPEWFAQSGAITLFLVAAVQFKQLGLLHRKHINNAELASRQQPIHLLSEKYQQLERRSLWAALFGTAIWAFGDKLFNWIALPLVARWVR